jgi:hypothetical protein
VNLCAQTARASRDGRHKNAVFAADFVPESTGLSDAIMRVFVIRITD